MFCMQCPLDFAYHCSIFKSDKNHSERSSRKIVTTEVKYLSSFCFILFIKFVTPESCFLRKLQATVVEWSISARHDLSIKVPLEIRTSILER